ncbi:alpha-ketoglutarate decarboxylase [Flavivirga aquimarina]|uniref:Alpha-ketoglutarate decarboxylase n=1 Tax=Flavivirga aquimarina TaxID=2027862 RepID=A0ABT8WHN4_9FLAO|nr:alpha-ketoglutarate decarboxylase [Flavivirga aquimarina]MDO5972507.1 alpha-ketoglutarate decarboxylase [Flavivirga aquimarina]
MINKNTVLIILVVLFSLNHLIAQQKTNDFWNHVRFGGGIGLNFGDGFFSGTLAPNAIYEFDRFFAAGIGLNATFDNQKNVYKSTILGGSLIGLFNVINEIQLSAEFEQLNINRKYNINLNTPDDNYWSPALFIGAGYRNGNVTFGIRYDVLYDKNKSIYIDPWAPFVRFYF